MWKGNLKQVESFFSLFREKKTDLIFADRTNVLIIAADSLALKYMSKSIQLC